MPSESGRANGAGSVASGPAASPSAAAASARRVILIFVDGLGWGEDRPEINPCLTYGGRLFDFPRSDAGCRPVDACLGVDGTPQSATGQTSLLTGVNAQAAVGRHVTGFPTPPLREILKSDSIFVSLRDAGRDGIFLNAFRPLFFRIPRAMQERLSATTVAHLAADRPFFGYDDLRAGRCLYQEFTNRELVARGEDVPVYTPAEAGRILGREAVRRDFTLFEYFRTDRAGHAQDRARCERELRGLDAFVRAVLAELAEGGDAGDTLVLLCSDHGNLEDLSTRGHTRNPVPLMAWGAGAETALAETTAIDGVTPAILAALGIESR